MKKLNGLLTDEESVRQLSELAQIIGSESGDTAGEEQSSPDGADIGDMLKIGSLLSSISENDSGTEFLLALRPHVKEKRQKRVDKAVKLLRLMTILESAKKNGLLNDII